MKKSTITFLIMFVLGCGIGIFAPTYLLMESHLYTEVIWIIFWIAVFLMIALGITAGWNIKRFFFAPAVPPALGFLISIPILGWVDWVCGIVAVVAFMLCLASMLITALILYLICNKRRTDE